MAAYVRFRAYAFHVLNHPTWGNPSVTNDNTGGGEITGPKFFQNNTRDARFFQLSLKYAFQPTPGRAKYQDSLCSASCDPVRNFLPHARLRGLNLPCNMQLLRKGAADDYDSVATDRWSPHLQQRPQLGSRMC
jgi:hypothetical protein